MIVLETKIEVNIDVMIPASNVTANPLIGPVPKYIKTKQTAAVVIFASKMADKAKSKPFLTDKAIPEPFASSSLTPVSYTHLTLPTTPYV